MVNLFHGWDLKLNERPKTIVEKKRSGWKKEDVEHKKAKFDPRKTKVPTYDTIAVALSKSDYGQIFTTPKSNDIYVITRGTWGEKSKSKVVKSFPPGTPYREIKSYSLRTKTKHGGKPMMKGEKGREQSGYATKNRKDTVKNFKPVS